MIAAIKLLFSKIPGHWWRNGARGVLTSACAFYILNVTEGSIVDRYLSIVIHSLFWRFAFYNLLVYGTFYFGVDMLLRLLAFKVVRDRMIARIVLESQQDRIGFLRGVNEIKNNAIGFVMGYPVGLGYVSTGELREIGTAEPIEIVPVDEKEKAVNEVITALNKWACVLIHLIFTLFFVWHYDKILLVSIFILGFVLTLFLYIAVIIAIHNVEMIANTIQKECRRLK